MAGTVIDDGLFMMSRSVLISDTGEVAHAEVVVRNILMLANDVH